MRWRLRKIFFALVVLAGVLAVGLEFAARTTARQVAAALAPVATLTYSSAGIALDGRIRLDEPRLALHQGPWPGIIAARRVELSQPGLFWLVRAILDRSPQRFGKFDIETHGLDLPDVTLGARARGWLGLPVLVPFETIGCDVDTISDADRRRMGVVGGERRDRLSLRHDAGAAQLDLILDLESPGVASQHVFVSLSAFGSAVWSDARARQALRVGRAEVRYDDPGYLSRRNQFCAQRLGIAPDRFVARHLEAVDAYLLANGIEAGDDVRTMYRQIVENGGTLSFASFPDASWVPDRTASYSRPDLLRLLSVTVRHDNTPPVMLRLAFSEPPATEESGPDPVDVATAVGPAASDPAPAVTALAPVGAERAEPIRVVEPAGSPSAESEPIASAPPPDPPAQAGVQETRLGASGPAPPKDSTLALVWREGVIERLPQRSAPPRDYDVVAATALGQYRDRRVRLLTAGGKLVEGRVKRIDGPEVVLSVRIDRGEADLSVPLANIREARLIRGTAAR